MQFKSHAPPQRVTEEQVRDAERLMHLATRERDARLAEVETARRRIDPLFSEFTDLTARVDAYNRMAPTRDFFDRTMTRTGGAIVCVLASVGTCLIVLGLLGAPAWLQWLAATIALVASLRFGLALTVPESKPRAWEARLQALMPHYDRALEYIEPLKAAHQESEGRYREASANYFNLRDLFDRVHGAKARALLACGWEMLRGIPFENFLAQVFENLGYTVQTTPTTGDHGIDLIVSKGDRVIAVQAKGYKNSVGNDAVQQAYSGKDFYRRRYGCNACVVITNSTFTKAAQDLAAELGCALIDRSTIPRLVRGELAL